jgi:hypothetical protein
VAVLSPPGYLQAGVYSALLDRVYLNTAPTLRSFPSSTISAKPGFWPAKLPTYAVVSGMDVAIGPCAGLVANGFVSGGGEYAVANPTATQVTLAGSSPTLNRNDIIGFYVRDNFYDASGFNQVTVAVIQGTNSAGAPTDPALPPSFLPVARGVVSAGATSPVLQGMISRTVSEGGLLQVGTDTERTSLGTPYYGYPILRTDQYGLLQVWNGTNWWSAPNPPYLHMRQTVAQSIPNAAFTALTFGSEDLDNFAGHAGSAAGYTCQRDGVYLFGGGVTHGLHATGQRIARWALGGVAIAGTATSMATLGTGIGSSLAARPLVIRLVVGNVITLETYQNSGGALSTLVTGELQSSMSAHWIAP